MTMFSNEILITIKDELMNIITITGYILILQTLFCSLGLALINELFEFKNKWFNKSKKSNKPCKKRKL